MDYTSFYYIFYTFILLPIGISIYRFKQLARTDKLIQLFLIVILLKDFAAFFLATYGIKNHFLYPIRTIICFWVFTFYYTKLSTKIVPPVILLIVGGLFSTGIITEIMIRGFNAINTYTLILYNLAMIIYATLYINKEILNIKSRMIDRNSYFWMSLGFWTLGTLTLISNAFKNHFIETSLDLYFFFDSIAGVGNALASILFAFGFLVSRKKNKV